MVLVIMVAPLSYMVRLPAVLIVVTMFGTAGISFGEYAEITVYPDGLAHITARFDVDPQEPSFVVELLGSAVDNFVAVNEDGILLGAERTGANSMVLETFDSGMAMVSYDVHDIVSKDGRIWTFMLDVDYEYTVLMPGGAIIVGLSTIPDSLDTTGERIRLEMPGGAAEISYVTNTSPEPPPDDTIGGESMVLWPLLVAVGAVGAFVAVRLRYRRRGDASPPRAEVRDESPDPEAVFARVPGLRDEDKEIVRYICEIGGEVSESRLRKKFLRPKTTMWRAVQRLSREGVVDVTKKDSLNHIRIRRVEEEQ